jgi:GNAT superfamily N-acetyltransferase
MNIRTATPSDIPSIARVHMESWRDTYRGLVSDHFLDNLQLEARIDRWQQRLSNPDSGEFAYVAEDVGGDVIAFATGGPEQSGHPTYTAELIALHVSKPYQGIGLGTHLFRAIAAHLQSQGCTSLLVWVLKGNPAQQFYEKLGGVYVADRIEEFAGGHIPEVAYGWTDLSQLTREQP